MLAGHGAVAMVGVLASRDDGVWGTVAVVDPRVLASRVSGVLSLRCIDGS